ncbi:hypothetical protein GPECTOR_55g283 [Gonium pectorale]|uniref:Sugar phosphate transporter domain-containing protein n=1 Tax=Gonium pectorale TaxID=33097 RepID=A0A150G6A6_GONPE|nr:hypothetical protein GPECTOR_55g283 [Gonium pectorale]|eukprot:KXZ45377.1 hypothetical protein GPECTOR_55g283 [Gonium pectorale]
MTAPERQKLLDEEEAEKPQQPIAKPFTGGILNIGGLGTTTVLIIIYYAFCSSLMLVVNKVVIHMVPAPTFVLCIQLFVSVVVVLAGDRAGWLVADALEWAKVSKFIWVVIGFLGTLMANIKVLQNANVETFITFRSSTPLVLSLCDYLFLGRALPSGRSWACLVVLLGGSLGYVLSDADFRIHAYYWLMLWYVFFTFDTVYVKHMCDTLRMTNWGRVYYANVLAFALLTPCLALMPGERALLAGVVWDGPTVSMLALSCAMGVGMSHASYLLREAVSATLFTIVGILCKVLTVIVNVFIWDKHASPAGIAALMVCVLAGTFYQQAPKRPAAGTASGQAAPGTEGAGGGSAVAISAAAK